MKTYKMILTGNDGTVFAVANTELGLIRQYNKTAAGGEIKKLGLSDLSDWTVKTGKYDAEGNTI